MTRGTHPRCELTPSCHRHSPCPAPRHIPLRTRPYGDRRRSAAFAPSRSREPILPSGILFNSNYVHAPVARSCYQFWNIWSRQIELNIDSSNQSTFSTITQYGIRQLDTRCCPLDQFGLGEFTGDVFASSNLFRNSLAESEILHP